MLLLSGILRAWPGGIDRNLRGNGNLASGRAWTRGQKERSQGVSSGTCKFDPGPDRSYQTGPVSVACFVAAVFL